MNSNQQQDPVSKLMQDIIEQGLTPAQKERLAKIKADKKEGIEAPTINIHEYRKKKTVWNVLLNTSN